MTKTMRNVMIVVPVLIMSCQVSENLNSGPVIAQTAMTSRATTNAMGRPENWSTVVAMLAKPRFMGAQRFTMKLCSWCWNRNAAVEHIRRKGDAMADAIHYRA